MKRLICLLLSLMMALSLLPFSAFAESEEVTEEVYACDECEHNHEHETCDCDDCEHEHVEEEHEVKTASAEKIEAEPAAESAVEEAKEDAGEQEPTESQTESSAEPAQAEGTVTECEHENAERTSEWLVWAEAKDNDDGTHTGKVTAYESYRCPDCGAEWKTALTDKPQTQTAAHDWKDGVCIVCAATEPAAEDKAEETPSDEAVEEPESSVEDPAADSEAERTPGVTAEEAAGLAAEGSEEQQEEPAADVQETADPFADDTGMPALSGEDDLEGDGEEDDGEEGDPEGDDEEGDPEDDGEEGEPEGDGEEGEPEGDGEDDPEGEDESTCAHENATLVDSWIDDADADYEYSTRLVHIKKAIRCNEYSCPDCEEDWIDEIPVEIPEKHTFEIPEDSDDACCIYCYASGCSHNYQDKIIIKDCGTSYKTVDYTDNGNGTHTCVRYLCHWYTKECAVCGEIWNIEVQEDDSEEITENHDWFEGYCVDCGATNACKHPDAAVTESEFQFSSYKDNGDGTHTGVAIRRTDTYVCSDCGFEWTETTDIEETTVISEHRWYLDDVDEWCCMDCYAYQECTHENATCGEAYDVEGEEYRDNGDGTHSFITYQCKTYTCPDCGFEWNKDIEVENIREEHDWLGCVCKKCDSVKLCTHSSAYVRDEYDEFDWEENIVNNGNGTHTGTKIHYIDYYCPDCKTSWEEETPLGEVTEKHLWYDQTCVYCSAENTCTHKKAYKDYSNSYLTNCKDNLDGTHTGTRENIYYRCDTCGDVWEADPEPGVTEKHIFENGECSECGAENTCAHPNKVLDRSFPFLDNCGDNGDGTHTGDQYRCDEYSCPDCGESWDEDTLIGQETEEHIWYLGECEYCNAVNVCSHENASRQYDYYNWYSCVDNKDGTHTGEKVRVNCYECLDCGTEWDEETYLGLKTEAHDWWNGECDGCGAVNTCNHKNAVLDHTWFDMSNCIDNKDGTHTGTEIRVDYYECPGCGEGWSKQTSIGEATYEHSWSDGKCMDCDAVNICEHEDASLYYTYYKWINCVDNEDGTHTGTKIQVDSYECPGCSETWAVQTVLGTDKAEHEWYKGSCEYCDAENACSHAKAYKSSSYTDYVGCVDNKDGTHTGTIKLEYWYRCPDCGEGWSQHISSTKVTEQHHWGGNGTCYACRAANTCTHPDAVITSTDSYLIGNDFTSDGDETHTGTITPLITYTCPDCGEQWTEEQEKETITEEHCWDKTGCTRCDAVNPCDHPNATKSTYYLWSDCVNNKDGTHTGSKAKYNHYVCADCGGDWFEFVSCTVNATGTHNVVNKLGYCSYCGADVAAGLAINCSVDSLTLATGQSRLLGATATRKGSKLSYTTSNAKVVTVDTAGKITAKATGIATVTIKATLNGVSVTKDISVVVIKAPGKVTLSRTKAALCTGETLQLSARHDGETEQVFTWTSSSKKLATVTSDGLVSVVGSSGTVTITAKTFNGKSAACTITLTKVPTDATMKLSVNEMTLGVGMSQVLKVVFTKGYGSSYIWESSDPSVASIASDGTVTANAVGTATITATAFGDVKKSCTVTVKPAPSEDDIITNATEITLGVKETFSWKVSYDEDSFKTTLSYASSNKSVASVSSAGKITANKAGDAEITVTTVTGVQKAVTVTVKAAPSKVTLNKTKATMGTGQTLQLSATLNADASSAIAWSSSNKKLATVNATGLVTITGSTGTVTITAKTYNEKSAACTITVVKAPTEATMKLSASELTLGVGMSGALKVTFTKGYGGAYTLTSADDAIASVTPSGSITAKAEGTTVITVTTYNGVEATCTVNVKPAPKTEDITVPLEAIILGVKESFSWKASYDTNNYMTTLTYSSGNAKVAKIDKNGKITALKKGTTTVQVTTLDGITFTAAVTVVAAPTKVTMSPTKKTLVPGDTFQLTATHNGKSAQYFTWSSSNKKLATVDENGLVTIPVTAKKGTVKITAKTFNGLTATCTITIKPAA